MNERIRELAEQAGLEFDDDLALEPEPIYYTTQKDLEKFAELIVRECVEVAKWTPSQFPNDEYVKNIKEHFGVK